MGGECWPDSMSRASTPRRSSDSIPGASTSASARRSDSLLPAETLRRLLRRALVLHDRGAPVDARLLDGVAAGRRVQCAAIVPEHDVALLPLVAGLRPRR